MPFLGHPFRLLFATAQSLALVHVIYAHGLSIGSGWGPSMVPTFLINREWFVVDKRYRRGRGVRVGDCVTYAIPVEPGEEGVKRVMGMPGDYVLLNSPPSPPRASSSEGGLGGGAIGGDVGYDRASRGIGSGNMIQVPKGHCYIVGDNLPWSRDSRDFGPIPLALIKGKVIAKACLDGWNPMNWFTRFENGLKKPADISDSSPSSQGP
ncbi:peptidase S24/S26A/S26B/S26C [Hypoxylon argillaceum]|nr:peptidase S24/S26A/S26B/S26C [Hypoxylon argillaceum]KAI1150776.1 peptidase S24/S26A/S26B/S26C [Nemania diffusa]